LFSIELFANHKRAKLIANIGAPAKLLRSTTVRRIGVPSVDLNAVLDLDLFHAEQKTFLSLNGGRAAECAATATCGGKKGIVFVLSLG
jgi:hypothetical protein